MGIPQTIWVVLMATSLLITLSEHGKRETTNILVKLPMAGVHVALLYWGGFFG